MPKYLLFEFPEKFRVILTRCSFTLAIVISTSLSYAQVKRDSTQTRHVRPAAQITVLAYVRAISDAKGNWRIDQNLVANFRLNKLLRLEGGVRFGERPHHFKSYYHYKLELQTKWFYNTFRVIGRISDNVILHPDTYRKTNEIIAAESRFKLNNSFTLVASGGFVFSATDVNNTEAWPTHHGTIKNYPVWKTGIRYRKDRVDLETTYGSYDTFNPYEPDQPFLQETFLYELGEQYSIYGNFRYQFDRTPDTPLNYFFGAGVRLRFD